MNRPRQWVRLTALIASPERSGTWRPSYCGDSARMRGAISGRSASCSTRRPADKCLFEAERASKSARRLCTSFRLRCPRECRRASGLSFSGASQRSPPSATSEPARYRPPLRRCSRRRSLVRTSLRVRSEGPPTTVFRNVRHVTVRSGDVLLFVGTSKGAFILRSNRERSRWEVGGPYFHGQAIHSLLTTAAQAATGSGPRPTNTFWGTFLRSTDDFGKSWTNPPRESQVRFPADAGVSLRNIWQICIGRPEEPDVLYCGAEPAALFESRDSGSTWSLVRGLDNHPHRPRWVPGNGGLFVHTILLDPEKTERMHVGISAGGFYSSEDGGVSWEARNRGIRVVFAPEKYPEFGQCVHKVVMHPSRPERLFLQNHWGLYRSDDFGKSWKDVANGVPSDFGFAMVMHPQDANCVYVLPVESDEFRCTPGGRLRVYRTRNAGISWEPLMRGLPQKGAYETILRDAMTQIHSNRPASILVREAAIFMARTMKGRTWKKVLDGLPAVLCAQGSQFWRAANCAGIKAGPASRGKAVREESRQSIIEE